MKSICCGVLSFHLESTIYIIMYTYIYIYKYMYIYIYMCIYPFIVKECKRSERQPDTVKVKVHQKFSSFFQFVPVSQSNVVPQIPRCRAQGLLVEESRGEDSGTDSKWINMLYPIGSMYAIYGNIYHQYTPNVSIYTMHGSYMILWVCVGLKSWVTEHDPES